MTRRRTELSAEEAAEIEELPRLPGMVELDSLGQDPADASTQLPGRRQRLNEHALDQMARLVATGTPTGTVAGYFGMSQGQVVALGKRQDFARRVEYYRAKLSAQAAMNLTKIYLASDRILDNVLAVAQDASHRQMLDAAKMMWNEIMPRRPEERSLDVNLNVEPQVLEALSQSLQGLAATIPHRRKVGAEHVTRGAAGMPRYEIEAEPRPLPARSPEDGDGPAE